MDYSASATTIDEQNRVYVNVQDERPYVKNGDKDPWYVGKYRGGFGNPWDVTTENDIPLAELLSKDLTEALLAEGFDTNSANTNRTLTVLINDWNFDGYQNGRFWYDLEVIVSDQNGQQLESTVLKEETVIDGTFWGGAKAGFEKQMPTIYKNIIASIVSKNQQVLDALRR
jgi:hypothetical protein